MIDLMTEHLRPLVEIPSRLPPGANKKKLTFSTVFRWVQKGVLAPNGQRIKLEAIRLGGRWLTSDEALQRFAERCTPGLDEQPTVPRSSIARQRAARELDRIGI